MPGRQSLRDRELEEMRGSSDEDDGEENGGPSTQAGPSRKRRRFGEGMNAEDIFVGQDPEEKREVTAKYRVFQAETEDMQANSTNITIDDLRKRVRDQGKLFGQVRDTSLATVDARIMKTTADTALGIARKMRMDGNAFDIDEFLIRTKTILGLDRIEAEDMSEDELDELAEDAQAGGGRRSRRGRLGDWEKIGWIAASLNRGVPGVEFMNGPIGTNPKKRTATQRRRQTQIEPEVRPAELQTQASDKPAKDDTIYHVGRVDKVLSKVDPEGEGVNFFHLAVNPDDYAQTVENCFYISFLIRDGKAGMRVKPDGEVLIVHHKAFDADTEMESSRHQAVLEIDMATWKKAIEVFNITRSTIPHRKDQVPTGPMGANTWYA